MPVAPGAADVDGAGGRIDRDQAGAERACGLGDLDRGLATLGQPDQEGCDRLVGRMAVQHVRERPARGLARQWRGGVGQQRDRGHASAFTGTPAIVRKLASIAWPCSVAMLSGWNCTPWIGNVA